MMHDKVESLGSSLIENLRYQDPTFDKTPNCSDLDSDTIIIGLSKMAWARKGNVIREADKHI